MSYNILCFCGGGIRGLASATMLNELYTTYKYTNIISGANMLAGTSTGGGIIAALASGSSPKDLIDNFKGAERLFFSDLSFNPAKSPTLPQYDVKTFYNSQPAAYKDNLLSQFKAQYGFDLLMTSFNTGNGSSEPWQPVLFTNLTDLPYAPLNQDAYVADAVVATGSMQGMFGAHPITSGSVTNYYVDGAYVNHDPTLVAVAAALQLGYSLSEIAVLCFGTGLMTSGLGAAAAAWGPQQWQAPTQNPYNLSPSLVNGLPAALTSICLDGPSTNLIPTVAQMMLGTNNYAYLNPTLDQYIPENDTNLDDLNYLEKQAEDASQVNYAGAEIVLKNFWQKSTAKAGS